MDKLNFFAHSGTIKEIVILLVEETTKKFRGNFLLKMEYLIVLVFIACYNSY